MTHSIAFVTVYLHSYYLIIDILRILKFIQCLNFFIKASKIFAEIQSSFFKVFSLKLFLFSLKHSCLLTAKITCNNSLQLAILCNLYMVCKISVVLRMLDATFGVSLWPLLNWGSMYMSGHFFCKLNFKRNINICHCNVLCLDFPTSKFS